MKRTVILVVLDGWGIGAKNESNPIYMAGLPTFEYIEKNFRSGALQASGISVGLPWEEEGNSEVGHLTIGSGMVLYQHYPRITLAIRNESIFENKVLKDAFIHAKEKKSAVHLVGMVGEGNVHSSFEHLKALVELAKREQCEKLYLDVFTDGRDGGEKASLELLQRLEEVLKDAKTGIITSIGGRYYAMDRDNHWDRVEKAYNVLLGNGPVEKTWKEALDKTYAQNLSDEYVVPSVLVEPRGIKNSDAVIFWNFREDRMRELAGAFLDPSFSGFKVQKLEDVYYATLTSYDDALKVPVVFETPKIGTCLARVISESGKTQLHIAETEKYAHVTYFFNGLREEPYPGEYRILIPSRKLAHHEEHPEMMAGAITDRVLASLSEGVFDFIMVNYANADIIAHSGNYEATVKAVKVIDEEIRKLVTGALDGNHQLIITSDHGNSEVLLDLKTGQQETRHNVSPVPVYLIGREYGRSVPLSSSPKLETIGFLSDVAPTLLELLKLEKPKDMTGESLISQLLVE